MTLRSQVVFFFCSLGVSEMVKLQQWDWGIFFFVAGSDSENTWMLDKHPVNSL